MECKKCSGLLTEEEKEQFGKMCRVCDAVFTQASYISLKTNTYRLLDIYDWEEDIDKIIEVCDILLHKKTSLGKKLSQDTILNTKDFFKDKAYEWSEDYVHKNQIEFSKLLFKKLRENYETRNI